MSFENKVIGTILIGGTALAANIIAPKVVEILNKNEKSLKKQICNTFVVVVGCVTVGTLVGTVIVMNQKQNEILELLENSFMEEAS